MMYVCVIGAFPVIVRQECGWGALTARVPRHDAAVSSYTYLDLDLAPLPSNQGLPAWSLRFRGAVLPDAGMDA